MPTPDPQDKPPRFIPSTRADRLPAVIEPDPTGHDGPAARQPEPPAPRTWIDDEVLARITKALTFLALVVAVVIALVEQSPVPMSVWSGACIAVVLWAAYRRLLLPIPAGLLVVAAGLSLACWLGGPWWLVLIGVVTTVAAWAVQAVTEA